MINNLTLVGRLTKDPELRYLPNGTPSASFTLAVNRSFTNSQGEREADFINCVIFRKAAENVANYLKKGSLAGLTGRIQTRNYENNEGKRVYITEVVAESVQFLDTRGSGGTQSNTNTGGNRQNSGNSTYTRVDEDPFANDGKPINIQDDDLPF